MTYPGSKTNSGIQQFLINRIPSHHEYYELFAGTGALFYAKRPASGNFLNDLNPEIIAYHKAQRIPLADRFNVEVLQYNAVTVLRSALITSADDFIYLDPPYPASARKSSRPIYRHEMLTDDEHRPLLEAARACPAQIMISTRENPLYTEMLRDWYRAEFQTVDRGGVCTEVVFMNYPEPAILHQYDFIGDDYTERQRIKRKREKMSYRLHNLPRHERQALIEEAINTDPAAAQHFLSMVDGKAGA